MNTKRKPHNTYTNEFKLESLRLMDEYEATNIGKSILKTDYRILSEGTELKD